MILVDVNVLVYAHREDTDRHNEYRGWLEALWSGSEPYGVSDPVLSGCLRILTHPKVFDPPSPGETALAFVDSVTHHDNAVKIVPGRRHWEIFVGLVRRVGARGNTIPDAYLAALAIESGSEFVTTDRGFAQFPDLRWRHPLER